MFKIGGDHSCVVCHHGTNDLFRIEGKATALCKKCFRIVVRHIMTFKEPWLEEFISQDIVIKSLASKMYKQYGGVSIGI